MALKRIPLSALPVKWPEATRRTTEIPERPESEWPSQREVVLLARRLPFASDTLWYWRRYFSLRELEILAESAAAANVNFHLLARIVASLRKAE